MAKDVMPESWLPFYGESELPSKHREPFRQNLFILELYPKTSSPTEDNLKLKIFGRTASLPSMTVAEVEDNVLTQRYYLQGTKYTPGELRVDFLTQMNPEGGRGTFDILFEWLQKAVQWVYPWAAGWAHNYSTHGYIYLLDYSLTPVFAYELFRLWPTTAADIALDYATGEIIRISTTFRCDRFLVHPVD